VALELQPLKSIGQAQVYLDFSAQHVVNEKLEPVEWSKFSAGKLSGVRLGTKAQCVLCAKGDKTNINWGTSTWHPPAPAAPPAAAPPRPSERRSPRTGLCPRMPT